ncbi:MAG: hypothetical protein AAF693_02265 [Bacteroidota bacterium]
MVSTPAVYAQEGKSTLEKRNERKNKSNRRLKRRGDKGKSNKRSLRETRFKTRNRQGEKAFKGDITGRKVVTKISPRPSNAAKAKPNPYAGAPRGGEKSRFRARSVTPRFSRRPNERAARGTTGFRTASKRGERAWRGNAQGRAISTRSKRTTFTRKSRYQRFPGSARSVTRDPERPRKRTRIIPRSVSGTNRIRKGRSPYSTFRRQTPWEKAFKGDITGRTFRTKRTTERPLIQKPAPPRYSSKGRVNDRPYKGRIQAGYRSATKKPENAWKKDISGHKLRIRTSGGARFKGAQFQPYPKRKRRGDRAYKGNLKGGGYKSVGRRTEVVGQRIRDKNKGGGSIARNKWNNRGRPVQGKGATRQDNSIVRFQGNLKGGKPLKGGGSVSRNNWNNRGRAIQGRGVTRQDSRVARFQGNLKGGKPAKGGGSIARNNWNNRGKPVQGRGPTRQDNNVARFQGNLKGYKPYKGGGSVSRNNWNNNNKPTTKERLTFQDFDVAGWKGRTKRRSKRPSKEAQRAADFTGKTKQMVRGRFDGYISEYRGEQKRKYAYKKNPNAVKESLKVKEAGKNDRLSANFQGFHKRRTGYVKNKSAADESLKVRAPNSNYKKRGGYQGNIKRTWRYVKNRNSADEALKGIAPSRDSRKAGDYQGRTRLARGYSKKPHAADGSLKGIGPSRAAIRASNYQGNVKMSRKYIKNRHPSFKYDNGKDDSNEFRKGLFKLNLLWAKLFKKNENQPKHLKEKVRKPRFDKKEQGLWYD